MKTDETPKVGILILNWNGETDCLELLGSLEKLDYPNAEILVVDNGSKPGSLDALRRAYPNLDILENGKNLGYAEGNNRGFQAGQKRGWDYHLVLNNDLTLAPDCLQHLVEQAEAHPECAILGPRVFRHDEPETLFYPGWKIDWQRWLFIREAAPGEPPELLDADFVQGCALLIRADALRRLGGFDPAFYLYCEDADLAVRARKEGGRVVEVRDGKVYHKGYGSSGRQSPLKGYYGLRNRLLFIQKHAPPKRRFALTWRLLVFDGGRDFLRHLGQTFCGNRQAGQRCRALLRAVWDWLRRRYGRGPEWLHR